MKNVGLFSKNVGDFLKNVGLFPKNVGDFLNYLRRFFLCFVHCFFSFYVLLLLVLHVVFFLFMRRFLLDSVHNLCVSSKVLIFVVE